MEMDRPPACKYAQVQDGKQRIYLEWPSTEAYNSNQLNQLTLFES